MGMALDEPKDNDMQVNLENVNFLVDGSMARNFPQVNIGYRRSWLGDGFYVEAAHSYGAC